MRIQVRDGGEFSCEVTGFHGYEQQILGLRNANRDEPETLEYLAWRYRRSADSPEPQVFWLLSPDRQRVGMASVVFRPYWSNNTRVQTAVVGDISLDTRWRGRGLGQVLLRFMTEYLDVHFPRQPAFVDRKSTRLNSSHSQISYAVFCLKKKKRTHNTCE